MSVCSAKWVIRKREMEKCKVGPLVKEKKGVKRVVVLRENKISATEEINTSLHYISK